MSTENTEVKTEAAGEVKHSYPMAIHDASFGTAFGLLAKTMPYALLRFGILVAITIVTIIWTGIGIGGYVALANWNWQTLAMLWGLFAAGSYGGLWGWFIKYALYMLKCGHIAVITELITKGSISNGSEGMFSYGKRIVTERFKEVNILFLIDRTVDGVIQSFNRTLDWVAGLLPIPGLDSLMQLVHAILHFSATFIDETIFSYTLARGETNPWLGARDGLIYYCQNCKEILKTALWAVVLDKVLTFLMWVIFMLPGIGVAVVFSSVPWLSIPLIFGGLLLGSNARAAFLEPLFLIMIMVKFHVSIENQPINTSWDEKLTSVSNKFTEIKNKAAAWINTPAQEAQPQPVPEIPAE